MDEVLLYSGQSVASKILLLDALWQSKSNKWFENKPSQQNYKLQQILKIQISESTGYTWIYMYLKCITYI